MRKPSARVRLSWRRGVLAGLAALVVVGAILISSGAAYRPVSNAYEHPRSRTLTAATSGDPLASGSTVALGVGLGAPDVASVKFFSRLAGARPRLVMWYQQWSEPLFYPDQLANVASLRAYPMITWDPIENGVGIAFSQILAGRYDEYIRASAAAAARWHRPIYIRFGHEMNLPGSLFGPGRSGNTPSSFIAAWRHVVTIFRRAGAWNVEWVWSPNVDCERHCPFVAFYPGDAWVDWVALDGYNYGAVHSDVWLTFARIFGPPYSLVSRLTSKPMMIAETSSSDQGGSKAEWILGMGQALASNFTRVRAIVWFQRVKEADWRINSSPQALVAFRTLVRSPLFTSYPVR